MCFQILSDVAENSSIIFHPIICRMFLEEISLFLRCISIVESYICIYMYIERYSCCSNFAVSFCTFAQATTDAVLSLLKTSGLNVDLPRILANITSQIFRATVLRNAAKLLSREFHVFQEQFRFFRLSFYLIDFM